MGCRDLGQHEVEEALVGEDLLDLQDVIERVEQL